MTSAAVARRREPARSTGLLGRRRAGATISERNCSVGRTVSILNDSWAFLILRECYFAATRFETFQLALGIPRETLTLRLRKLTLQGLLKRSQYSKRPVRFEYRLTEKGLDLYPAMTALLAFGDKWLAGKTRPPLRLVHNACSSVCQPIVGCSHCLQEVTARTVAYRDGPGAGRTPLVNGKRSRRSSDSAVLDRGRPSSVARTLKIIGDRWSFMVIREAFFGVRRFDDLQSKLGIAPNILADRLNRLVADSVLDRRKYQDLPMRMEYRLTEMGKDLFGPMIAMLRWGDRWLSDAKPPLLLKHLDCDHDFIPTVMCNHCRGAIRAGDMGYRLNYRPIVDGRVTKPGRPIRMDKT